MTWYKVGTKTISVTVVGTAQAGSFDVKVSPTQVSPGGTVRVDVTVTNPNSFSTQFQVIATLFGKQQSKTISVGAAGSGTASFTFTAPSTPGSYSGTVAVNMYVPDYYKIPGTPTPY